jgi:hypothetical protein
VKLNLQKLHPAGMHRAVITSVVEEDTQYGPSLKFGMVTDDGTLSVICSTTYSAKSKLGRLTEAILGSRPEEVDTDHLKGKQLLVMVEHEMTATGTWDRVTAFAPYREGTKFDPFEEE